MSYTLRLYDFEDASEQDRRAAEHRFRTALESALGDAAMVAPVYTMYLKLLSIYGEAPPEDALTEAQREVFTQWQAAESAAVTAAFGAYRYMGDAQFEIGV
ncbi:MAG: hypothetical protein WCH44_13795 [Betaproteobacteria bacterium]